MFPFKVYFSVRCIYFPFKLLGNKYVSGYGARPSGGAPGGECIAMHQSHCSALQLQPLPLSGIRGRPSSPNTILVLPIRNFGCLILEVFQKPQKFFCRPSSPHAPNTVLVLLFHSWSFSRDPKSHFEKSKKFFKSPKSFSAAPVLHASNTFQP